MSVREETARLGQFEWLRNARESEAHRDRTPMHVLLLADDKHPANVVHEHVDGIAKLSRHCITVANPRYTSSPGLLEMGHFDAILIHYSIFILAETYLPPAWSRFIEEFAGVKAIIHEDEYQRIDAFKRKISSLGIHAVFSCLDSPETMRAVYADPMLGETRFYSCLPGYIVESLHRFKPPAIADRPLDVVYRGRTLPPHLGRHAQDKRLIGEQMLAAAAAHDLKVDISSDENSRIYGEEWPKFLMSGRATLGVEGGATIFDFDGSIAASVERYRADHPDASFEQIWSDVLADHEGNIDYRTITPKFFEAIAAKTALILYPGQYNGLLEPNRHYIPLERDGSNIDTVVARLRDAQYLQDLVDRAYDEIMRRPDLQMSFYVSRIDDVLTSIGAELVGDGLQHPLEGQVRVAVVQTRHALAKTQLRLTIIEDMATALKQQQASCEQRLNTVANEYAAIQQRLVHCEERLAQSQERLTQYDELMNDKAALLRRAVKLIAQSIGRRFRK